MTKLLARAAFAALAFAAAPASAQDEERGYPITIGAGTKTYPKYPASNSYCLNPLPIFGFRREDSPLPLSAPDDGIGVGFFRRSSAFNFGPAVRFQNKREEVDVGAPVGDVGFTFEAGGFCQGGRSD